MKPVLFLISGDPRTSRRPAEAVRIAAGVGTWKQADMTVCLRGAAVLALSEVVDGLVDEDHYTRYLPIIAGFGRPIYVEKNAPQLAELKDSPFSFQELSLDELAALAATSASVISF
jgi:hypothetical protein